MAEHMEQTRNTILQGKKNLHLIGIGGSGMFPIAQILLSKGYHLTGSDNNESDTLKLVRKMGVTVFMGHQAENIQGADLVIYSAAIMQDNPELVAARQHNIPTVERAEILGYITSLYKQAICICGTHGKTTTSAMTTQLLLQAGKDPSAVIGGKLPSIGGNGRCGESDILVCESCEYVDTFLRLHPDICVILNIDADHLEYFKTMDNLIASFRKFASTATQLLIVNGDDGHTIQAVKGLPQPIITFGLSPANDYYPENMEVKGGQSHFTLCHKGAKIADISLHIPGRHNILNAMAACISALQVGVKPELLRQAMNSFTGAGRRFELLGKVNGITIVDDYAHHPAELEVTLRAAKELDYKRVWAVFQPFTFSRTAMLLDDFARVLKIADRVVLSPIMGSREKNTYGIYSSDLAAKIEGCVCLETFEEISQYILNNAEDGDLVLTLGCGDIYKAAKIMLGKA